ncbi:alpha/beta hydrolase family protein [Chthonomonas calidirosea]|uniref:alpha/beta hydrolase family protein n=1 Tax=Chthonomonas calidirosea TaxID=454171 RepID=UPI0006EC919B|nr:alpha/beta hydrolase [Chthonomonas calidirosea]CEK12896.1 Alpha/beta hydrolase family [Chthonomonas calidirosea]
MRATFLASLTLLLTTNFMLLNSMAARAQTLVHVKRSDGRILALMVYEPSDTKDPAVAIISPGAGGTERGYSYLGEALSKDGWLAVVVEHPESGPQALAKAVRAKGLRDGLAEIVNNPQNYTARFEDIAAALQWVQKKFHPSFKALIGHSMGAITVQLEAGAQNKFHLHPQGGFDAYVALSPHGPGVIFPARSSETIRSPILMITGTQDGGLEGDYHWRMKAFEGLPSAGNWLAVIKGSNHMNFAGYGLGAVKTESVVVTLVTAFLDALKAHHQPLPPRLTGVQLITN